MNELKNKWESLLKKKIVIQKQEEELKQNKIQNNLLSLIIRSQAQNVVKLKKELLELIN